VFQTCARKRDQGRKRATINSAVGRVVNQVGSMTLGSLPWTKCHFQSTLKTILRILLSSTATSMKLPKSSTTINSSLG